MLLTQLSVHLSQKETLLRHIWPLQCLFLLGLVGWCHSSALFRIVAFLLVQTVANGNVQQLARELHNLIFREALSQFHQPTFVCNLHLLHPPFNLWPEACSFPCLFSRPTELIPDQRWNTQRSWPSSAPWARSVHDLMTAQRGGSLSKDVT